jgi:probable F420-dependent oxidoreductase
MKIGVVFPHQEIGDDPMVIRDWAQTAEGLGYSHITAYDHVLGAVHEDRTPKLMGPYTEEDAFHEPMVLFGFLAGCTSKIELTTGILILPQRQTSLVAKQVAEVDILSNGRMRLGVGTGWNFVEYDSLNEDYRTRGKRQVEQIEVLRQLWTEPVVDYTGQWHRIDRAGIKPLPKKPIPIWFGGFTEVAFRRAAKIGDGFILGGSQKANLAITQQLRELVKAEGRDEADFGIEALLNYQAGEDAWRGEVEAWIDAKADYVAMRATGLRGMGEGLASPQEHIDALKRYWDVVGDLS